MNPAESPPFLSLVIPAYNEEARIDDTLEQARSYLGSQDYSWEVVVVDDGSSDNTASLVNAHADTTPEVRLLQVPHRGKGWAVRNAMLQVTGQYRFLCDADLSMPIDQISRFFPPAQGSYDVAIGSRELSGSRRFDEPHRRHTMGRVYNQVVQRMALPGLTDTQCGFKCFRGPVAQELFGRQRLDGFAFDVELLFIARKRKLHVVEVPIDWYYQPRSKVRPVHDSLTMSMDILKIRWNHLWGKYRSSKSLPSSSSEQGSDR